LKKKFKLASTIVENTIRVEKNNGHQFVPKIVEAFPGKIEAISVGKPTLEDVFIHHTGHRMRNEESSRVNA
jgi:ABC-2 type transport system ATP-binding protein